MNQTKTETGNGRVVVGTVWRSSGLRGRMSVVILTLALVPLAIMGGLSYKIADQTLRAQSIQQLDALRDIKTAELKRTIGEWRADVTALSESPAVVSALRKLTESPGGAAEEAAHELFESYLDNYHYEGMFLIDPAGKVLAAVAVGRAHERGPGSVEKRIGANLMQGRHRGHPLGTLPTALRDQPTDASVITDAVIIDGHPEIYIGTPVIDGQDTLGILAIELGWEDLNEIMHERPGLGETGETYLVGPDFRLRSDTFLQPVQRSVEASLEGSLEEHGVDTEHVRAALAGNRGVHETLDYRKVPVLAASGPLGDPDLQWAVVAEVDVEEVFTPTREMLKNLVYIGVITLVVVILATFFLSRRIIGPVSDAVVRLTSAGAEILAATAQQASGASEHSSAVSQTVSTIDEVQRTSEQSAQIARAIVEKSRESEEEAAGGQESVKQAVEGMDKARGHVESVAENILTLAEHNQSIGDIIASVNEIAEQTNLLALNAAIEASRAGEFGKGFSVVASEIRVLAEQSKKATTQVREILTNIQKSTNDAVMATEESTRSVNSAVDVVNQAGQSIDNLNEVIKEAGQMAAQTSASASQQATGMAQVLQAMQNVDTVTKQTTISTQQVEQAAHDLNAVSEQLRVQVIG